MKWNEIHPDFRLNGEKLDESELKHLAFSFIREGEAHEQDLGKLILQWFDANDYVTLMTSGTTGEPKEIQLKKKAMIHSAKATAKFFKIFAADKALLCLPTRYIGGKMMFIRALVLGLDLDFVAPSSRPLEHNQTTYDFVAMVPLQVENSLEELNRVKKIIIGGAKVNPVLAEQLKGRSTEVYETYGMTETVSHIAAKKIEDDSFSLLPKVRIYTDDRGCLVIDAPKVARGLLVTNDLIETNGESSFKWLGRIDNVVNSGGVKLFPEQIEEKLAHYIPYRFFVIGVVDHHLGEKLVLVIESEPYTLKEEAINALSRYERPKDIQFVSKFEETPTGKILRKKNVLV